MELLQYLLKNPFRPIPVDVPAGVDVFTSHTRSGVRAILIALIIVVIVEMTALHYFLALWNHWVAWVATLSSLWVALTVIAQIRAVACRPIYVTDESLCLRNGMYDLG